MTLELFLNMLLLLVGLFFVVCFSSFFRPSLSTRVTAKNGVVIDDALIGILNFFSVGKTSIKLVLFQAFVCISSISLILVYSQSKSFENYFFIYVGLVFLMTLVVCIKDIFVNRELLTSKLIENLDQFLTLLTLGHILFELINLHMPLFSYFCVVIYMYITWTAGKFVGISYQNRGLIHLNYFLLLAVVVLLSNYIANTLYYDFNILLISTSVVVLTYLVRSVAVKHNSIINMRLNTEMIFLPNLFTALIFLSGVLIWC